MVLVDIFFEGGGDAFEGIGNAVQVPQFLKSLGDLVVEGLLVASHSLRRLGGELRLLLRRKVGVEHHLEVGRHTVVEPLDGGVVAGLQHLRTRDLVELVVKVEIGVLRVEVVVLAHPLHIRRGEELMEHRHRVDNLSLRSLGHGS